MSYTDFPEAVHAFDLMVMKMDQEKESGASQGEIQKKHRGVAENVLKSLPDIIKDPHITQPKLDYLKRAVKRIASDFPGSKELVGSAQKAIQAREGALQGDKKRDPAAASSPYSSPMETPRRRRSPSPPPFDTSPLLTASKSVSPESASDMLDQVIRDLKNGSCTPDKVFELNNKFGLIQHKATPSNEAKLRELRQLLDRELPKAFVEDPRREEIKDVQQAIERLSGSGSSDADQEVIISAQKAIRLLTEKGRKARSEPTRAPSPPPSPKEKESLSITFDTIITPDMLDRLIDDLKKQNYSSESIYDLNNKFGLIRHKLADFEKYGDKVKELRYQLDLQMVGVFALKPDPAELKDVGEAMDRINVHISENPSLFKSTELDELSKNLMQLKDKLKGLQPGKNVEKLSKAIRDCQFIVEALRIK